ncbi:MAG: hypothetical protein M1398_08705 [Deltaproteobacteria bacterium]|jgi:hypothetical protein|nr:hypothetical protein [Deltaproteobacteria bacterium]
MGVIQDGALGEVFGEAPFAEALPHVGIELAAAVAKGAALRIVQAHSDGICQERGTSGHSGFKPAGGGDSNRLGQLQEGRLRIKWY